jgi:hypothetical protein
MVLQAPEPFLPLAQAQQPLELLNAQLVDVTMISHFSPTAKTSR